MFKNYFLFFLLISFLQAPGQEINCKVKVLYPNVQTTDKQVFQNLEADIQDFMNTRPWTQHYYSQEEKIECVMIFTIDSWENETFSGNLQIKSTRPVFNSDYKTPLFIYRDNNISFQYSEYTTLEWDENSTPDNLIAILSYYSYILLGLDYDSFELNAGEPFFDKANLLVQQMQSTKYDGWLSFKNKRNRYWLLENIRNPSYYSFHECMYVYHRLGLDTMTLNLKNAKKQIKNSLLQLGKIHSIESSSHLLQVFFEAKSDELVMIINGLTTIDKLLLKKFLMEINPANTYKYKMIKVM